MASKIQPYHLLPFQFKRFDKETFLLVNECGEYQFLKYGDFSRLIGDSLPSDKLVFKDLKAKHFVAENDLPLTIELMANKYRTRKEFLRAFTSLHMMVVTLRCNQNCEYCQVSAESDLAFEFDMSEEVARKIVDCIFEGPSPTIKIEFQGGEPTLNWPAVTEAVEHAERLNWKAAKELEFVICTNLTSIDLRKAEYLRDHGVTISTSLDGNAEIHDKNRIMRNKKRTYEKFVQNLLMVRGVCGDDAASALMTASSANIHRFRDIVDEYMRLGFRGLFFRSLNPYGLADHNRVRLGYSIDEWVSSYKDGLDYIIERNLAGSYFVEYFTTLLLMRILTPFSTSFVDLQSPAGAGISGAIYDYNGDVYPADEGRMLARMGNYYFLLGNVLTDPYPDIFYGKKIREIIQQSNVEIMPCCASCVYQTYCGADPIRNYLETGDVIGKRPASDFCQKMNGVFDFLFQKLRREDEDEMAVFWSWITHRSLAEVKGEIHAR